MISESTVGTTIARTRITAMIAVITFLFFGSNIPIIFIHLICNIR